MNDERGDPDRAHAVRSGVDEFTLWVVILTAVIATGGGAVFAGVMLARAFGAQIGAHS